MKLLEKLKKIEAIEKLGTNEVLTSLGPKKAYGKEVQKLFPGFSHTARRAIQMGLIAYDNKGTAEARAAKFELIRDLQYVPPKELTAVMVALQYGYDRLESMADALKIK